MVTLDERLRLPPDPGDRPLGQHPDVGQEQAERVAADRRARGLGRGHGERGHWADLLLILLAVVRLVFRDVPGQRQEHVVERRAAHDISLTFTPAASSARTTSVASPSEATTGASIRRPASGRGDRRGRERGERRRRGLGVGLVGQRDQQPLPADGRLELGRRPLGDDLAAVDDRDPLGEHVRLVEVLGGEQQGGAVGDQLADDVPHQRAGARVEAGRRLVQEQHRRTADQRGRQVEPPPHAARVGLDRPAGRGGQVELLEQLVRPLPGGPRGQPAELADHDQVGAPGEVLVQGRVLAGEADRPAHGGGVGDHIAAEDARLPAVRAQQRRQDADGGGLARPVGAEQAVDGAGRARSGRGRPGPWSCRNA